MLLAKAVCHVLLELRNPFLLVKKNKRKKSSKKKKKKKERKKERIPESIFLIICYYGPLFSFSPLWLIKSTWLHGNVTVVEPEFFLRSIFFCSVCDFV